MDIFLLRQKFNREYRETKSRNLQIIYMYVSKHSGVLSYRYRSHIDKNNLSLALLYSLNELKQRISGLMMIMYGGRFGKKTVHQVANLNFFVDHL